MTRSPFSRFALPLPPLKRRRFRRSSAPVGGSATVSTLERSSLREVRSCIPEGCETIPRPPSRSAGRSIKRGLDSASHSSRASSHPLPVRRWSAARPPLEGLGERGHVPEAGAQGDGLDLERGIRQQGFDHLPEHFIPHPLEARLLVLEAALAASGRKLGVVCPSALSFDGSPAAHLPRAFGPGSCPRDRSPRLRRNRTRKNVGLRVRGARSGTRTRDPRRGKRLRCVPARATS
jgi:hypothetical protein